MRGGRLLALGPLALCLEAVELLLEAADRVGSPGAVALGLVGVVADNEALLGIALADADLLDTQVVTHRAVAAGARER